MDEKRLRQQGARCMDCGVPFCHTGTLISGMARGCPINNLIPEWNDLVYRGLWREALDRLHKTNNFPEFTGRVCPAPCEGSCVLGINSPPVTIKNIEVAIIDRGFEEGWVAAAAAEGAHRQEGGRDRLRPGGPRRRGAAQHGRAQGHRVRARRPPRRPADVRHPEHEARQARGRRCAGIKLLEARRHQVHLQRQRRRERRGRSCCCKDFDAIVICTGATQPRDLPVEGRKLKGVHFAMDYLTANTKACSTAAPTQSPIHAQRQGRHRHRRRRHRHRLRRHRDAPRLQERSTQLEILPKPPMDRAEDNPWPEWPKVYKMDYGQEEAAAKFGADPRVYLTTVKKFVGDAKGAVKELVHRGDRAGRRTTTASSCRRAVPAPRRRVPAQLVLLAMGFLGPEQSLLKDLGVERDARSNVKAEHEQYATSVKGVFAAGDCRRGQSLVVWAINEGRGAARECDRYLMGSTELP